MSTKRQNPVKGISKNGQNYQISGPYGQGKSISLLICLCLFICAYEIKFMIDFTNIG